MINTTYTNFRKELSSYMDKVNDDHTPLLITRSNGKPAVLMSLDDFHSYEETQYLNKSDDNEKRLKGSVEELEERGELLRVGTYNHPSEGKITVKQYRHGSHDVIRVKTYNTEGFIPFCYSVGHRTEDTVFGVGYERFRQGSSLDDIRKSITDWMYFIWITGDNSSYPKKGFNL